jgi:hypothetical protein
MIQESDYHCTVFAIVACIQTSPISCISYICRSFFQVADLLGPLHLPAETGNALHATLDALQSLVRHLVAGDASGPGLLHGADAGGE